MFTGTFKLITSIKVAYANLHPSLSHFFYRHNTNRCIIRLIMLGKNSNAMQYSLRYERLKQKKIVHTHRNISTKKCFAATGQG